MLIVFPYVVPRREAQFLLLKSILFVCLEAFRPGRNAKASVIHLGMCLCFEVPRSAVTSAEIYIIHVLQLPLGVQESTRRFRTDIVHLELRPADCNEGGGRRRESGRERMRKERTRSRLGAPRSPLGA